MQISSEILNAEICPYCESKTKLVDSSLIYGKSYGPVFICSDWPECDAFVGCHKDTTNPLGRLADPNLRMWKKNAHAVFDELWKSGVMSRGESYQWLSSQLKTPLEYTHIGMFDVETCKKAVKACQQLKSTNKTYRGLVIRN